MSSNTLSGFLTVVGCVVAGGGLVVWLCWRDAPLRSLQRPSSRVLSTTPNTVEANQGPVASSSILLTLRNLLDYAPDANRTEQLLSGLRRSLAKMEMRAAVSGIRQFLDSKADAPTFLGFKVGAGGFLGAAPTMRTFLLDYWGQIDPVSAADYARTVLASMDSPDEWAVALRNLARGDLSEDGRALLTQKVRQMLQVAAWQRDPTVGFLEAFDVAVYLGGSDLMPVLSELVRRKDNPAVAHAAFLALDRLVIAEPATELAELQAAPDLMQGRELTRANYFARADVRDQQQRKVLERYLLDPHIGAGERAQFAGLFPNASYMISANLLTTDKTPNRVALLNRDAESLRVIDAWVGDARFAGIRPELDRIKIRLEQFAQQISSDNSTKQ